MGHENQKPHNAAPEPVARSSPHPLLVTKFLPPVSTHALIARPRLLTLLNAGQNRHLVLVSAAAGFGKTTLLANWVRSLVPDHPSVAWMSLDATDNAPVPFWTSVLTALEQAQPGLAPLPVAALSETTTFLASGAHGSRQYPGSAMRAPGADPGQLRGDNRTSNPCPTRLPA